MNTPDPLPDRVAGNKPLAKIEGILCYLSAIATFLMMLVVVIAVGMRYFVGQPLAWTYEIISSYLMVCLFFLAISEGLRIHSHIAIDVFRAKIPQPIIHIGMAIGYAGATLLMIMIARQGLIRLESSWLGHDVISMTTPWPTWPTFLLLTLGCLIFALRCLIRTIAHLGSLFTGRQIASIPASNGETGTEGAE